MTKRVVNALVLFAVFTLAACSAASTEQAAAQETLQAYLKTLASGDYARAAMLYGGEYRVLQDWNPDFPPDNHPGLLARGCERNGLQCLPLKDVLAIEDTPSGYVFTITLLGEDGAAYARPPDGQSQFRFTVVSGDGGFRVQELPPYVP